jgi:hypothetical protein
MLVKFGGPWNGKCYILRPVGIFYVLVGIVCDHLVHFLRFGMFEPRKIWQPCWALQPIVLEKMCFGGFLSGEYA